MRVMSVAAIALCGVGALQAAAQETTHGCACIHNKTKATISYRYKWGEGQWQNVKLQPAYKNWMCWNMTTRRRARPACPSSLMST